MENNHIDQQFNEASKFSEEPVVFPGFEKIWGKIEEKLDKKVERKKMVPLWLPYGVAASLIIGCGVFYFMDKKVVLDPVNPVIVEKKASKGPSVNTNITKIDSTIKENIHKEKRNIKPTIEKFASNAVPAPHAIITEYHKNQADAGDIRMNESISGDAVSKRSEGSTQEIDEVALTALGIKRKVESVTTANTLTSTSINNLPQADVFSSLEGRVAGIQVTLRGKSKSKNEIQHDSNTTSLGYINNNQIMIRGIASAIPHNQPLYIINGEVADADRFKSLDPDKIKNLSIIKEAEATALYGSKAVNGVVVITTKKLSRKERKRIEKLQEEVNKQNQTSPTSNNEGYDSFVENPFELTQSQPLSTFSIDVDNASYSNVRRMINNGQAVDKNAVRIEEMINYFKYEYPQPKGGDPFSINTEYNEAPWNPNHKLLKIGLQGKNLPIDRLPASNMVFLIDVSGSMDEPNKLPLLKSSFKILLNQLRPEDKIGIVVYAGSAGMVLPPTSAGEKDKILKALDNLQAGGSTAGGAGIELAYKMAQESYIKDGNNRVIIATDGDFNVGMSSTSDLKTLIEKKRKSGVFLTCLGFGIGNYKDNTLETLADKGNGNYAYIDNMQEAHKFLGKEFAGSMYAIAKDVKIQIEFNPTYVKSYRLIGYENRKLRNEDFVNDKIDAGELGSGHTVTALYEIIPVGSQSDFLPENNNLKYTQNGTDKEFGDELATIKFRYKKPDEDKSKEISQVVKNSDNRISVATQDFKFASSVAWFGLVLRSSQLIQNKDLNTIENLAKEGKNKDEEGYRSEFIRLIESYKAIKE